MDVWSEQSHVPRDQHCTAPDLCPAPPLHLLLNTAHDSRCQSPRFSSLHCSPSPLWSCEYLHSNAMVWRCCVAGLEYCGQSRCVGCHLHVDNISAGCEVMIRMLCSPSNRLKRIPSSTCFFLISRMFLRSRWSFSECCVCSVWCQVFYTVSSYFRSPHSLSTLVLITVLGLLCKVLTNHKSVFEGCLQLQPITTQYSCLLFIWPITFL